MAKPKKKTTTITESLARRVQEVREVRGLSLRETARRLNALGHSMDASGLMRLESGERRVTVEDLIHLALVLDVSPDALVLPLTDDDLIEVPGIGPRPAGMVRLWFDGSLLMFPDVKVSERTREMVAQRFRWISQRPLEEQRQFIAAVDEAAGQEADPGKQRTLNQITALLTVSGDEGESE